MADDTHGGVITQEPPATYLTPKDLQHELQIGEKLCYKLLKSGEIPPYALGGFIAYPASDLRRSYEPTRGRLAVGKEKAPSTFWERASGRDRM